MKITLEFLEENPDGSQKAKLDIDQEGAQLLLEYGLNTVLQLALKNRDAEEMVTVDG